VRLTIVDSNCRSVISGSSGDKSGVGLDYMEAPNDPPMHRWGR